MAGGASGSEAALERREKLNSGTERIARQLANADTLKFDPATSRFDRLKVPSRVEGAVAAPSSRAFLSGHKAPPTKA
jgi:hypothetical protein